MSKRLSPNNRPWPKNMAFDFGLLTTSSPADVEGFIAALPTSDRNKEFLRLRYRESKTYTEIAAAYGMTPAGVRLATIAMREKFGGSANSTQVAAVENAVPQCASTPLPTAATPPTVPAAPPVTPPSVRDDATKDAQSARPLSINLAAARRTLGLTPEEFARPVPIEDGESLITRLETGFSRPSVEIVQLICEAWEIRQQYLVMGKGEMFELVPYCDGLIRLLGKYLVVATFDRKGQQYWKGSLVNDLLRLIDVRRLTSVEMCRVVRVLYDYLDVEQFCELLERMGK